MKKFTFLLLLILIPSFFYSRAGNCPELCITSTNKDCLTTGESSSLWYQVCFTSNGTFQFYIDPSGNRNDFDFAIWDNTTYPPTTTSIRCSSADVSPGGPCDTCDYTGLGNGATDSSESASGNGWLLPLKVTTGQCITININNYGSGSNNFTINLGGTAEALPASLIDFYSR